MTPVSPDKDEVEQARETLKRFRDFDAPADANLLAALDAAIAAMSPVDRLREALEACREKFAEYVELHKAKLHDGTPTAEWLSVRRKVDRNQEMVDLCDAALSSPEPVGEVGE